MELSDLSYLCSQILDLYDSMVERKGPPRKSRKKKFSIESNAPYFELYNSIRYKLENNEKMKESKRNEIVETLDKIERQVEIYQHALNGYVQDGVRIVKGVEKPKWKLVRSWHDSVAPPVAEDLEKLEALEKEAKKRLPNLFDELKDLNKKALPPPPKLRGLETWANLRRLKYLVDRIQDPATKQATIDEIEQFDERAIQIAEKMKYLAETFFSKERYVKKYGTFVNNIIKFDKDVKKLLNSIVKLVGTNVGPEHDKIEPYLPDVDDDWYSYLIQYISSLTPKQEKYRSGYY